MGPAMIPAVAEAAAGDHLSAATLWPATAAAYAGLPAESMG